MTESTRSSSEPYVSAGHGDAWAAEAAARGSVGTQRLLRVAVVDPTEEVATALDLEPDDQVVMRSRLILSDHQPVEIATSYYPASLAIPTALANAGKIKGGAMAVLAELGREPSLVVEALTARWPTPEEAGHLEVDDHEAMLVLSRTSFDREGRPVEYAANVSVGRRSAPHIYRLKVAA